MNIIEALSVIVGITYLALQTIYMYEIDLWYDEIKKPKYLPKHFCVQCFATQFGLIVSFIIVMLLQMPLYNIIILSLSTAGFVTLLNKIDGN
jgi:hypothetical protein